MNGWVQLPATISPSAWRAVQARLRGDMRSMLADAGLRYRVQDGRIALRGVDAGPLVYAVPLQRADGVLRADAGKRLVRDTFGARLEKAAEFMLRYPGMDEREINRWTDLQLALLQEPDTLKALRDLAAGNPQCRVYRLGGTRALMVRQIAWRIIGHLLDGTPPDAMPLGSARRESLLLSGLLEAVPGATICAPLTARFQPLAAVMLTRSGAEMAMLLAEGSGFVRMPSMDAWPVGTGRPSLAGPGKGIYNVGVAELPAAHAEVLLQQSVEGVNRLLYRLTDPAMFADSAGFLDRDEQMIAWANLRFGLDAINSVAASWGTSDAIWAAFRALGTLQGLWEGRRQGSVPLWELLAPQRIRDHALPAFTDPTHHRWAAGLVDNYERELRAGFPGSTSEDAARHIQELRHLVHGAGGQGARPRNARIATLRYLANHTPNVQLVCDMASLWWTALLFDPERVGRLGRAPWVP